MRRDRFVEHVRELLSASGHPGIDKVDYYDLDKGGLRDLRVTCTDGRVIYLNVARMSPPGGDNFGAEEQVVTKS